MTQTPQRVSLYDQDLVLWLEDVASVIFPDRWPLSQSVDDLLSVAYWAE